MSEHTPGPWKLEHGKVFGNHGQYITRDVSDGRQYVARMDGSTYQAFEQKANARLISFAPELLDELKAQLFFLQEEIRWSSGEGMARFMQHRDRLMAVLSKVEPLI